MTYIYMSFAAQDISSFLGVTQGSQKIGCPRSKRVKLKLKVLKKNQVAFCHLFICLKPGERRIHPTMNSRIEVKRRRVFQGNGFVGSQGEQHTTA